MMAGRKDKPGSLKQANAKGPAPTLENGRPSNDGGGGHGGARPKERRRHSIQQEKEVTTRITMASVCDIKLDKEERVSSERSSSRTHSDANIHSAALDPRVMNLRLRRMLGGEATFDIESDPNSEYFAGNDVMRSNTMSGELNEPWAQKTKPKKCKTNKSRSSFFVQRYFGKRSEVLDENKNDVDESKSVGVQTDEVKATQVAAADSHNTADDVMLAAFVEGIIDNAVKEFIEHVTQHEDIIDAKVEDQTPGAKKKPLKARIAWRKVKKAFTAKSKTGKRSVTEQAVTDLPNASNEWTEVKESPPIKDLASKAKSSLQHVPSQSIAAFVEGIINNTVKEVNGTRPDDIIDAKVEDQAPGAKKKPLKARTAWRKVKKAFTAKIKTGKRSVTKQAVTGLLNADTAAAAQENTIDIEIVEESNDTPIDLTFEVIHEWNEVEELPPIEDLASKHKKKRGQDSWTWKRI